MLCCNTISLFFSAVNSLGQLDFLVDVNETWSPDGSRGNFVHAGEGGWAVGDGGDGQAIEGGVRVWPCYSRVSISPP